MAGYLWTETTTKILLRWQGTKRLHLCHLCHVHILGTMQTIKNCPILLSIQTASFDATNLVTDDHVEHVSKSPQCQINQAQTLVAFLYKPTDWQSH